MSKARRTQARRTQARHRATDGFFPGTTRNPEVTQLWTSTWTQYIDATKGAAESIVFIRTQPSLNSQCPSIGRPIAVYTERIWWHEKYVVSRSRVGSEFVDKRVREYFWKTFGNFDLMNWTSVINTARDCMRASFQISRIVETCTKCCQNNSSTNTQNILNIVMVFLNTNKVKIS